MYVQITKLSENTSGWYNYPNFIGAIFEIVSVTDQHYVLRSGWLIKKSDCKIIELNDNNNNDQITEEMADKLLDNVSPVYFQDLKDIWIKKGLIKQSREEQLKENISHILSRSSRENSEDPDYPNNLIGYQKELIEILEGKD